MYVQFYHCGCLISIIIIIKQTPKTLPMYYNIYIKDDMLVVDKFYFRTLLLYYFTIKEYKETGCRTWQADTFYYKHKVLIGIWHLLSWPEVITIRILHHRILFRQETLRLLIRCAKRHPGNQGCTTPCKYPRPCKSPPHTCQDFSSKCKLFNSSTPTFN